ncbi:MAG: hypothetical protein WC804_11180 [Sphingomonas sp.]|jgi:hypothetical protein|uniref:hypothetical protein n=1 Tax=Sphingomonas sp. TaxID=28214 RepID=UPI003567C6E4
MANDVKRHPIDEPHPGRCCPHCGAGSVSVVKRGAITILSDPDQILWRGRRIPLSPTEAHVFRTVAIRGRATYEAIDEALTAFGSNPATRAVVMLRIRQKFVATGANDPFWRFGNRGVGLRLDEDTSGSVATTIGLSLGTDMLARVAHA